LVTAEIAAERAVPIVVPLPAEVDTCPLVCDFSAVFTRESAFLNDV